MNLKLRGLLLGAFFIFSTASAHAQTYTPSYVIRFNPGGKLGEFIDTYEKMRSERAKVIVDGECLSACTLLLGIIAPENVCATPRASFGFHSAATVGLDDERKFSLDGTMILWHIYPTAVKQFLTDNGFDPTKDHPELLWADATQFVQPCDKQ